jgi:anti-anti-sigma factor
VQHHEVTAPTARVLPRFQVGTWVEESKAIVFVWGEVDCATAPRLAATLADMTEQGRLNLVVDLSGVYFMDSTGLAVLAVAHKRLQQAGGGLVLAGPTPAVRRSIEITGRTRPNSKSPTRPSNEPRLSAPAPQGVGRFQGTQWCATSA